jgi:hypothetical protein
MNLYRQTAIIAGILFLVCTGATLLSFPFGGSLLGDADYLAKLAGNQTSVISGALIEFIWAATCAGIALASYPILRRYNSGLALASVAFRVIEGVFVLVGTLSMLSLLTLSQDFIRAGAPAVSTFQTSSAVLLAVRDWSHNVISALAFSVGALMYYAVLYSSNLIPRWLSGWGFLGALLGLAATLYAALTNSFDTGSVHTYLNIPVGVSEIMLALWLIAKGFNPSAIASAPSEMFR